MTAHLAINCKRTVMRSKPCTNATHPVDSWKKSYRPMAVTYRQALAPGSYLALSSGTREGQGEEMARAVEMYERSGTPIIHRSRDELRSLMTVMELPESKVAGLNIEG